MSYKSVILLLCLSATALWLCGCGGSPQPAAPSSGANTPVPPPSASNSAGPANPTSGSVFGNLQDSPGWTSCTKSRNGSVCAAGRGAAVTWMAQHQTTPSLSGSAAQFYLGGSTGYSNALWWTLLGSHSPFSRFTYDLWFYVDDASRPEALEFDVNQTFGNARYIFGTECSYRDTKHWDVWDGGAGKWVTSSAACPPVASKTWHHLVWELERANGKVHYIAVTLDGNRSPVNLYLDPQAPYGGNDISVAFQLDGDVRQSPYSVWLDKVTLQAQ